MTTIARRKNCRPGETRLLDGGFRAGLALTCLFAFWFMFAADDAGAAAYKQQDQAAARITFASGGHRRTGIRTVVPTLPGDHGRIHLPGRQRAVPAGRGGRIGGR